MKLRIRKHCISLILLWAFATLDISACNTITIGAFYFDGWSGQRSNSTYHSNAPTHLSYKLYSDYSDREPIWGWRDDDIEIMERQIDLASKNGIDYFIFCWYWRNDLSSINVDKIKSDPLHTSLDLFMRAKNRNKMKFCILIANHPGARISGADNWKACIDYLSETYLKDNQYLTIDGKPVVQFFSPEEVTSNLTAINEAAVCNGFTGLYTISSRIDNSKYSALSRYNTFEAGDSLQICEASELIEYTEKLWHNRKHSVVIPTCMAGWDKRPWFEVENFKVYKRPSAKEFYKHLDHAFEFVYDRDQKEKMVQIYAWNEYGEGGYLAPTKGDKKALLLKQIRKVKRKYKNR